MSSDSPNAASAGGAHSRGGSKSPLTTHRRPSVQERRRVSEVPGLLHQDGVLPSGKYVDPAERMRSGGSSQVERLKTADSGGRLKTADSSGGSSGGGGSARVMSKTGKLLVVNVQQETQKEIVTSSGNRLKVAARRSSQLPSPSPTPGRASPDVVGSPALGARARRGSREGRQSSLEDFAGSPKQGASSRRTSREVAGSRSPQQGGRGRRASRGGDASPAPARSRQASREPVPHLGSSGPQTSRGSQLLGLEAFSVVAEQAQVVAEARVGGDKFAAEFAASSVQVWSEEEDVAATKIQSIARGMQTRKSLKNVALEQALEDDSASSGSYSSSGSDSVASFMLQKHPVTLQVEAKEGKIETRNIPGGTFPYLVVNCGEYQQATSSVQVDTNSPFWKDTFVFSIDNLEDDLVINCHHWDGRNRGPGRNLGQVVFNLRHLLVGNLAEDLNSSVHGSGSASRRDEANTSRATDTPVFREGSANLSTNLSSNRKPWSKNTMKQQSSLRRMGSGASAQLPGDKKSRPTSSNRTGHEQTTSSDRSSVGQRARPPSLSHGLNRHPGDTAYNREVSSRSPLSSNQSTPRNNARDSARHSGSGGGNSTPSSQQSGAASTLAPMMQMRARKGKVHKHGALSFQEFEQWMPFIDPVSGKKIGRGAGLRLRLRPWAPGGLTAKDLPGSEEDEAPVKGIFGFFRRKGPVKKSEDSSEEGDAAKEERGDDDSEFQSTSSDEKSVAALSDSDASNDYSTPDEIDEQIPPTDRGFSSHIPVPCDAVMSYQDIFGEGLLSEGLFEQVDFLKGDGPLLEPSELKTEKDYLKSLQKRLENQLNVDSMPYDHSWSLEPRSRPVSCHGLATKGEHADGFGLSAMRSEVIGAAKKMLVEVGEMEARGGGGLNLIVEESESQWGESELADGDGGGLLEEEEEGIAEAPSRTGSRTQFRPDTHLSKVSEKVSETSPSDTTPRPSRAPSNAGASRAPSPANHRLSRAPSNAGGGSRPPSIAGNSPVRRGRALLAGSRAVARERSEQQLGRAESVHRLSRSRSAVSRAGSGGSALDAHRIARAITRAGSSPRENEWTDPGWRTRSGSRASQASRVASAYLAAILGADVKQKRGKGSRSDSSSPGQGQSPGRGQEDARGRGGLEWGEGDVSHKAGYSGDDDDDGEEEEEMGASPRKVGHATDDQTSSGGPHVAANIADSVADDALAVGGERDGAGVEPAAAEAAARDQEGASAGDALAHVSPAETGAPGEVDARMGAPAAQPSGASRGRGRAAAPDEEKAEEESAAVDAGWDTGPQESVAAQHAAAGTKSVDTTSHAKDGAEEAAREGSPQRSSSFSAPEPATPESPALFPGQQSQSPPSPIPAHASPHDTAPGHGTRLRQEGIDGAGGPGVATDGEENGHSGDRATPLQAPSRTHTGSSRPRTGPASRPTSDRSARQQTGNSAASGVPSSVSDGSSHPEGSDAARAGFAPEFLSVGWRLKEGEWVYSPEGSRASTSDVSSSESSDRDSSSSSNATSPLRIPGEAPSPGAPSPSRAAGTTSPLHHGARSRPGSARSRFSALAGDVEPEASLGEEMEHAREEVVVPTPTPPKAKPAGGGVMAAFSAFANSAGFFAPRKPPDHAPDASTARGAGLLGFFRGRRPAPPEQQESSEGVAPDRDSLAWSTGKRLPVAASAARDGGTSLPSLMANDADLKEKEEPNIQDGARDADGTLVPPSRLILPAITRQNSMRVRPDRPLRRELSLGNTFARSMSTIQRSASSGRLLGGDAPDAQSSSRLPSKPGRRASGASPGGSNANVQRALRKMKGMVGKGMFGSKKEEKQTHIRMGAAPVVTRHASKTSNGKTSSGKTSSRKTPSGSSGGPGAVNVLRASERGSGSDGPSSGDRSGDRSGKESDGRSSDDQRS